MATTLFTNGGFVFSKINHNQYCLTFHIANNNVRLSEVLNFSLLRLIYDLNTDIYDSVTIHEFDDLNAEIIVKMNKLFEELGLPPKYVHNVITKTIENDKITFIANNVNNRPDFIGSDVELLPIESMIWTCQIENPHKIHVKCDIKYDDKLKIPSFGEQLIGMIIFKVFKRLKQFIEKVHI